ncbi:hypothetical protein [Massilia sp. Se16.2.3]|uniref:hypothetical protein n=1 Tax=Massilia sp. Se16.2.3 TaxID=2709303 RepID=UPI00160370AD|nr:hypothetical protein [Massilia sp. Se16.2.3]QNB00182.1 hypothetical protein G4G31_17445 [Massilia sp. Se16.2.3]
MERGSRRGRRRSGSASPAMACRHGSPDAVALALGNGADPLAADGAALAAAAAGPGSDEDTPARQGEDEHVMQLLLGAASARAAVLATALQAAAGADRIAMLDFLLEQGASLDAAGPAALAAAARHLAFDAFEHLLGRGADARGAEVLAAAVTSLDETMVEAVLAAGADVQAHACVALTAAFSAQPGTSTAASRISSARAPTWSPCCCATVPAATTPAWSTPWPVGIARARSWTPCWRTRTSTPAALTSSPRWPAAPSRRLHGKAARHEQCLPRTRAHRWPGL